MTQFTQEDIETIQAVVRNSQKSSQTSYHSQGKHWLLENFPGLLKEVQDWVLDSASNSIQKRGKLFQITEFQKFVNDFIVPIIQNKKDCNDISHSTARAWLNRLGYYDGQAKLQEIAKMKIIECVKEEDLLTGARRRTKSFSVPNKLNLKRKASLTPSVYMDGSETQYKTAASPVVINVEKFSTCLEADIKQMIIFDEDNDLQNCGKLIQSDLVSIEAAELEKKLLTLENLKVDQIEEMGNKFRKRANTVPSLPMDYQYVYNNSSNSFSAVTGTVPDWFGINDVVLNNCFKTPISVTGNDNCDVMNGILQGFECPNFISLANVENVDVYDFE